MNKRCQDGLKRDGGERAARHMLHFPHLPPSVIETAGDDLDNFLLANSNSLFLPASQMCWGCQSIMPRIHLIHCWGDVCVYSRCVEHNRKVKYILYGYILLKKCAWRCSTNCVFVAALFTSVYVWAWHMCDHLSLLASWAHSTIKTYGSQRNSEKKKKNWENIMHWYNCMFMQTDWWHITGYNARPIIKTMAVS